MKRIKDGTQVNLTDKCPLFIQEEYTPESVGTVEGYEDGKYTVRMKTETLQLRPNQIKELTQVNIKN